MPTLHLLGTGAAVADPHRTTTMLAFTDGGDTLVVDCGGDVVQRLLAAGIDLNTISALIITHEHPDHVSGFPLFMEKIWIAGRRKPIPVYGIKPALDQAKRCWECFDTTSWKDMPEIQWRFIDYEEGALVLDDPVWHVSASPVVHPVPNVGLRVTHRPTGRSVAYSCDTEPVETVVHLAGKSDILVHEANGSMKGHTSPEDAARIAARAETRRLLLVHVPPGIDRYDLTEARNVFAATEVGEELGAYSF